MYHPNVFTRGFVSLPLTLPVFPHMSHFPFFLCTTRMFSRGAFSLSHSHSPSSPTCHTSHSSYIHPPGISLLVQAASRALGDFYQLICRFRTLTAPTATRPPPQGGDTTPGGVRSAPPPHGGDTPQPPSLSTDRGGEGAVDTSAGGGWGDPPPTSRRCVCRAPSSSPAESGSKRERAVRGVPTRSTRAPLGGGHPLDPARQPLEPARGGGRGGAPTPREPRPCLLPPPQVKRTLSLFV